MDFCAEGLQDLQIRKPGEAGTVPSCERLVRMNEKYWLDKGITFSQENRLADLGEIDFIATTKQWS